MGEKEVGTPARTLDDILEAQVPVAKTPCAKLFQDRFGVIRPVLPPGLAPARFLAACTSELNMVLDGDPGSAVKSAYNAAMLGFIPGAAYGHCYFIPHKQRDRQAAPLVQLIIGYRGFLELAYDSGFLLDIHADVVLQGEEFKFWKSAAGPQIEHIVPLERSLLYDNVVGAYCIYHSKSGGAGIVVVSRSELNKVNTKRNVWASEPIAMCRKTPIRRAAKEWRQTRRLALASELEDAIESESPQRNPIPNQDAPPSIDLSTIPDNGRAGLGNESQQ